MFPGSYHEPAGRNECRRLSAVAIDIALELQGPIPVVRAWLAAVQLADMPEATVDEHCNSLSCEDEVRAYRRASDGEPEIAPIPEAARVDCSPYRKFGRSVAAAIRAHVRGARREDSWHKVEVMRKRCATPLRTIAWPA